MEPERVALLFEERQLSYGELNAQANRLAHRLIELGVGPDVLVGIAVERGLEMIVSLLAVLKAGGAYVPLDPEYPQERLGYMIEDSGIALLLSQSHLLQRLPAASGIACLALDQGAGLAGPSGERPAVAGASAEPRLRDVHLRFHRPSQEALASAERACRGIPTFRWRSSASGRTTGCCNSPPSISTASSSSSTHRSPVAPRWCCAAPRSGTARRCTGRSSSDASPRWT